jgi:hypothetical protein
MLKKKRRIERNKSEKTSSSNQQHKRTRRSFCTLLFTRIASAIALEPSSPMMLSFCETFRVGNGKTKRKVQQNKSETNVKHHSATQTHKAQLLHAAVHAHRIANRTGTVVADVVVVL